MSSGFMETSQCIAHNFVQSILFVDDKAYSEDQEDHPFDVKQMIKESAARGLIATAYAPEYQNDLESIVEVGRKADVIVLDWRIDIHEDSDQGQEDEEDEDVADYRGAFAIDVIKNLITENTVPVNQLKLIYIYTSETGLLDIFTRLNTELSGFESPDDFTLSRGGIRISIWAKDNIESNFRHMPENRARLRSYQQLLDEVPVEYATVSAGLLSNTCLAALTSLRNNTYKLLANFSPSLDPAFVAHRAMLPRPDDAGDLLKETICGELNSILSNENISQHVSSKNIVSWLLSNQFVDSKIKVTDRKKITIDSDKRELWQNEGYRELLNKELDASGEPTFNKEDIDSFNRFRIKKYACLAFKPNNICMDNCDEEFSILTHHKGNYLSTKHPPYLSLGIMVKDEADRYLICIQQKCDSTRIPEGGKRKFLFLPMATDGKNSDVIFKDESDNYIHLSTCYKECHDLEIIEFPSFEGSGFVQSQKDGDYFYFIDGSENEMKYKWILDLKEAHAQKIANNYAAQLARVGLDESEWLRRS